MGGNRWPTPLERYASYISIEADANGCFNFNSAKAGNGYGVMRWNGRQEYAHRITWLIYKGPIPAGKCVLHKCDNPACVNIDHLFLGSHKDNTQDMLTKGRFQAAHKLTFKEVDEIKARLSEGLTTSARALYLKLAKQYGVSHSQIRRIDHQENWRE